MHYHLKTINFFEVYIKLRSHLLSFDTPKIMGILNVTPDSFFDGGKYSTEKKILSRVEQMISEGADMIDVGAVSTRPGAMDVPVEEEQMKIKNAVTLIVKNFPHIFVSVDTWRSSVAQLAIDSGADIINDISGGTFDSRMFETIARLRVPYILMHTPAKPNEMQQKIVGGDLLPPMMRFFATQLQQLKCMGVHDVVIDPGFGFGKSLEQNYFLLNQLSAFQIYDCPVLVGISRKSMIYNLLGTTPVEALNGTTAVNTLALLNGANILRVHDVRAAVEARTIVAKYIKCKELN